MHRKLVFVLAMFAVAFGSLSQAQAALASARLPGSIATHSATGAVRAAAATRQIAHGARLRTEEKQGSRTLGRDRRATETASAPKVTSAASLAVPKNTRVGLPTSQACQITSPAVATFAVGQAGTFTVTTTGYPTCILPAPLTLPSGVTFTDNRNGTATLAGTPAANTGGTYPFTINATNDVIPDATQSFTLTVDQAPGITSPAGTTFTAGQTGTFTVTTTGVPNSRLSETGALPTGVTFKDNKDGTATLAGTPAAGSGGLYRFTITATNGVSPDATQTFTLTVYQACQITSHDHATFDVGQARTFTVATTGVPNCGLFESGNLPPGVTFTDNGNGTAAISGTPTTGGVYLLGIIAGNGIGGNAAQSFTLSVVGRPAAPSGLKATGKGKTVSLTWTNHASAPSPATAIQIQRSTNARFTTAVTNTVVGPTATSRRDTVVAGKKYYYRVRAHNAVGFSSWSNTASS